MFAYLKGTLVAVDGATLIVEVNSIGYRLLIPGRVKEALPAVGGFVQLYTAFVVREEAHTLYGFLSDAERHLFEVLMNIAGVGPKLALNLIGYLTFHEMQSAVEKQEVTVLCRVPGVGKKTAERLIVELKDRLSALAPIYLASGVTIPVRDWEKQIGQDAVLALVNLGYHQQIGQKAVKQALRELPESCDLALLITTALQHVSASS